MANETFHLHNRLGGGVDNLLLEGGEFDTTIDAGTPTEAVVYTLPAADGTSGQAWITDGIGNLTWRTIYGYTEEITGGTFTGEAATDLWEVVNRGLVLHGGSFIHEEPAYVSGGTF